MKYLKDTKIEYWKPGETVQNEWGSFDELPPSKVADLWANFKGQDYTSYFAVSRYWTKPMFVATITRPDFEVRINDEIKHDGKFYAIRSIDDLTGKPHSDMKLTCEYDEKFTKDNA